ncbi:MAG: hypothetical protein K2G35_02510, partial [Duncaniella sp.]|nr:hypothetical protein [Duncaniella sp.]
AFLVVGQALAQPTAAPARNSCKNNTPAPENSAIIPAFISFPCHFAQKIAWYIFFCYLCKHYAPTRTHTCSKK